MDYKKVLEAQPKGWFEAMERAAIRERGRKKYWENNYSHLMTYDRFVFIHQLEFQVAMNEMILEQAMELINKYDKDNPDAKF